MVIARTTIVSIALVFAACSGGGSFKGSSNGLSSKPTPQDASGEQVNGSAGGGGETSSTGAKVAKFPFGPKYSPADFLFVVDGSGSMSNSREKVYTGFGSVAESEWPQNARLAVMSTLPAALSDLTKVHPDVSEYTGIEKEPGFLALVDAAAVAAFRTVNASKAQAYSLPVCDAAWFAPGQKNSAGDTCLRAALQSPMHGVHCEAGVTVVKQIIQKNAGKRLFRSGSFLHVIFVSDAQDPGCNSQELINNRPTHDALKDLVLRSQVLSGVKFHGIVPKSNCTDETSEGTYGFPYNAIVTASLGKLLDYCSTTDYSEMAKQVAGSSAPAPVFVLPEDAEKLGAVKVGGVVQAGAMLDADKRTVRLTHLAPTSDVEVIIEYMPANK